MTERRGLFDGRESIAVRSVLAADRLNTRPLEVSSRLASNPLMVDVGGGGVAALFRYGAVVMFGVGSVEEAAFLRNLEPFLDRPLTAVEVEAITLQFRQDASEGIEADALVLQEPSIERLQVVAEVLAKSVVLDLYEKRVAQNFDRIEPFARGLEERGHGGLHRQELIRQIGSILLAEHQMVGRAEVIDKPDLLWENPDLERLYQRLVDHFELSERHNALEAKRELITRTAETLVNLENERRSLRVEWYIVVLIVVEILLFVYDLFLHGE